MEEQPVKTHIVSGLCKTVSGNQPRINKIDNFTGIYQINLELHDLKKSKYFDIVLNFKEVDLTL